MLPESERRGRPKKPKANEAQSSGQPEAVQPVQVSTPAELQPTTEVQQTIKPSAEIPTQAAEPEVETPAERITQQFVRSFIKEGTGPFAALEAAQNQTFAEVDMVEGLRLLNTLAKMGIDMAEVSTASAEILSNLKNRQKSYESALRRLDPRFARQNPGRSPSSPPSSLPPMTGKKG